MAQSYAEFLKANGASDEDVKLLDTPVARRAHDTLQSKLEAESAARVAKEQELTKYDEWYQSQALPEYKAMEKQSITNAAEAARYKAMVEAAQKQGLIDVADDAAAKAAAAASAASAAPAGFDPSQYFRKDEVMAVLDRAGDGLAGLEDLVMEHAQLFAGDPTKKLKVRELRKEAVAARKSVEEYWMEKYRIAEVRAAREKADKEAYEAMLIKKGREEATAEFASKYGNPDTRPAMPSTSPFVARPERDKQPWEASDRSTERVQKVAQKIATQ